MNHSHNKAEVFSPHAPWNPRPRTTDIRPASGSPVNTMGRRCVRRPAPDSTFEESNQ
jgi:hypothetical protein